ncbi:MAG: hypothetical protein POELPBGB_03302 [Bacteroidia bacterium]|nr:hypothetical protein [Bacteroidia bacterium]
MKPFTETQRFNQWWLWLIVIAVTGLYVYVLYQQLYLGEAFGNNPASNEMLPVFSAVPLLLIVFFVVLRLDTKIDADGVYYRFFPFQINYKLIKWNEIDKAYVRQYKPIIEYGGWGIRGWGKDKARNVSGNMGLQLTFKNGDKLLIGTQKAEEAGNALNEFFKQKTPGL